MRLSTNFDGKIIQVTEALDRYDAVSNQVVNIDGMLNDLGLESSIASKWCHPDRENLRNEIDSIIVSENDIIIYHFYGYSENVLTWIKQQYCTKIIIYHNITPHKFFNKDKKMAHFCREGRNQLRDNISQFHWFWGDSQFNVDELIELGADPTRTAVLPILVSSPKQSIPLPREKGQWTFIGRVAPNKGLVELVRLFGEVHAQHPDVADSLIIVGQANPKDAYVQLVEKEIADSGVADRIKLTGKVHDFERDQILRASDVYVSLSEHEGFGVPLIEAALYGVPVVALDRAATRETLGDSEGVKSEINQVGEMITRTSSDERYRTNLLADQMKNARRFSPESVRNELVTALSQVVPSKNFYKMISVIICTYNRKDHLDRCLDYLSYQSSDAFEVIVVNGPSDDGTDEILQKYEGRIKVVLNSARNLSVSRNLGIDASSGDIIAFIDDDAIPFDDWIATILKEYNRRPLQTAGIGGPAYYAGSLWFQAEDNGIDLDCQVKVNIASSEIGKNGWFRYNTGTNATFPRNYLEEIHGFDEQFDYFLDESELCFRLQKQGFIIGYSTNIYVRHEFAQSHNRKGKLNYNWHTICKNTSYFIATNSGREGDDLKSYIKGRMEKERVSPIEAAFQTQEITAEERDRHVLAIWAGVEQGLADAKNWPKTRKILERPETFLSFSIETNRAAVLRDTPPLHICVVSKELPPFAGSGGVGTLYYHLVSELLLMGHRLSLIVPSNEDKIHTQGRLKVYFTKHRHFDLPAVSDGFAGNVNWSLSALSRIAQIHAAEPVDVVDGALWDTETLAFSMLKPEDRPPLVVRLVTPYAVTADINGWNPQPDQLALFMAAERRLINSADGVIPISHSIAESVVRRYGVEPDARWSQGYCGIAYWPAFDVNEGYGEFPELQSIDRRQLENSKIVLFVGRLERRKGIDLILEAASDILASDSNAILVIAGRDPENWTGRFATALSPTDRSRVFFLGEVSDAMREKLMAKAYCLLFPSRYESFGLVPLEAFVHGVPVIAARAAAIPEVVIDGDCGMLFDPDNPSELAEKVRHLISDCELRDKMSKNAKRRVRFMSSRNSALHTIDVYMDILARRKMKLLAAGNANVSG